LEGEESFIVFPVSCVFYAHVRVLVVVLDKLPDQLEMGPVEENEAHWDAK